MLACFYSIPIITGYFYNNIPVLVIKTFVLYLRKPKCNYRMTKKMLIILILLINAGVVSAQQYTAKDLIGRWQEARRKQTNVVFLTDSTGAWIMNDGLIHSKMNYTAKADKDIIELKFTTQINAKNPEYLHPQIKFINDSVFLIRMMWGMPKNADTTNKKVTVFVKVKKEVPGTAMRLPSYKDLLGQWVNIFKKDTTGAKLNFIDTNRVIKKTSASVTLMDYVVDFTKQPVTIDFYIRGQLVRQSYLIFESPNDFRIEDFDPGKRKDHFTAFGRNYMYRREKPL